MFGISENNLKMIKGFTMFDDIYMSAFFDDFNEGVQFVLRMILKKDDLIVEDVRTQKQFINFENHSVRLDILATDPTGKKYNIEFQADADIDVSKRSRYYQSALDHVMLEKGKEYENLNESYIIFICDRDIYKQGRPIYHFTNKDDHGFEMGDRAYKIVINANYPGEWDLKALMNDIKSADPQKMRYDVLKQRARYFKEEEKGIMYINAQLQELINEENKSLLEQIASLKKEKEEEKKKYNEEKKKYNEEKQKLQEEIEHLRSELNRQ